MRRVLVLEGLPAAGKTTLAKRIASRTGATIVNESLGHPGRHLEMTRNDEFQDTLTKYQVAANDKGDVVVMDRGYPSLLAWELSAKAVGLPHDIHTLERWIQEALETSQLYEPERYIVLACTPQLSLTRRPRGCARGDAWGELVGLRACAEFYGAYFEARSRIGRTMWLDATLDPSTLVEHVVRNLA